jgi:putative protease
MMQPVELLAPARDLVCGLDAINCGADAVYIGASHFGARASAGNSVEHIERLAAYAHRYRAKVYATVNTLLTDEEMPRARKLIVGLWEAGVDAIIVQDLGLLEAGLPPVPLIASTQAHSTTPEKVLFLEKAGFKRVILARELSLEEIGAIRARTTVELEAFVHGALCVCYSGQCYLSYALGGRSGNRGECAQPCRLPYTLRDAAGRLLCADKHLLSLKDLNLTHRLDELAAAGVTSFKIEGRLKDPRYVRNIVLHYRRELDKVIAARGCARASLGRTFADFEPDPAKTFNRGFTQYCLDGKPIDSASPDTPGHLGEPLGPALEVTAGAFRLEGAARLHPGDGITFFGSDGRLTGSLVNGVAGDWVRADSLTGLERGTPVHRNLDHEFMRAVQREVHRRFALRLEFSDCQDGFLLRASDERGAAAEAGVACEKTAAQKPEQALDTIRKQLSKLGKTEFWLESLEVKLAEPYFLPVAVLNDLRRQALEALEKAVPPPPPREQAVLIPNGYPYPERTLAFTGNVLNALAARFYRRHGVTEVGPAAEGGADLSGQPLMTMKLCLRLRLGQCGHGQPVEPLYLEDPEGRRFRLEFDCASCLTRLYLEDEESGDEPE